MRVIVFAAMMSVLSMLVPELSLAAPAGGGADSVAAGRNLAKNLCSTCHDVSANQEFPPAMLNPAPTFVSIANRPGTTRAGVQKFLATPHGDVTSFPQKMPDLMLTGMQKEWAASYILSLRSAH
jgi:hypothetical protein